MESREGEGRGRSISDKRAGTFLFAHTYNDGIGLRIMDYDDVDAHYERLFDGREGICIQEYDPKGRKKGGERRNTKEHKEGSTKEHKGAQRRKTARSQRQDRTKQSNKKVASKQNKQRSTTKGRSASDH